MLIVGALVPVGGLVWGVVTHFVPKVEPATPPAPAPVPSVLVSGSGSVGVMSGGTINNGISAEQVQALLKAQGKQRDELLRKITRRYLELETRLSAIPVTSEQIKALVAWAEAGRFDEADRLLGEAVQMARADARRLKEHARASSRQAASVLGPAQNSEFKARQLPPRHRPQRPELALADLGVTPDVVACQVDVTPPERREVRQQAVVHRPSMAA